MQSNGMKFCIAFAKSQFISIYFDLLSFIWCVNSAKILAAGNQSNKKKLFSLLVVVDANN